MSLHVPAGLRLLVPAAGLSLLVPVILAAPAVQDPAPVLVQARTPEGLTILLRFQFKKGLSVEGKALPQALEEAARSAFHGARFQPGQQEGRAVRSRIRVEVSFDTIGPGR